MADDDNTPGASTPGGDGQEPAEQDLTLDELLVSVQKAFSRLSRASARVGNDKARALITGDVEFDISFNADAEGAYIYPQKDGFVKIALRGKIETDIRMIDDEDGADAAK